MKLKHALIAENNWMASYTDLEPGSYTFNVKSERGNEESWITSFQIIISPRFWKSWPFVTLCLIITGSVILLLVLIC